MIVVMFGVSSPWADGEMAKLLTKRASSLAERLGRLIEDDMEEAWTWGAHNLPVRCEMLTSVPSTLRKDNK